MNYVEILVSASLLASSNPIINFNNPLDRSSTVLVYALWLESADGKESTTSVFNTCLI